MRRRISLVLLLLTMLAGVASCGEVTNIYPKRGGGDQSAPYMP